MKKLPILSAIAVCTLLGSCNSDDSKSKLEICPIMLSTPESRASENHFDFSNELLGAVLSEYDDDTNVLISPVGVSMALSMLANGESQSLAADICNLLGADNVGTLNSLAKKIGEGMVQQDPQIELAMANSIWYRDEESLTSGFTQAMTDFYGADFHAVDFSDKATTQALIDNWASDHTAGKIKHYPYSNPELFDMLVNALYFHGSWFAPYSVKNTSTEEFYGAAATTDVAMMHDSDFSASGTVTRDESCAIIEKSFGSGWIYSVRFVLPDPDYTPSQLINDVKFYEQDAITFGNIKLNMPKFNLDEQPKLDLSETMKKLGVDMTKETTIFESGVALTHKLWQKCSASFDEEGAVVASVSSAEGVEMSPGWVNKSEITLNRPFLFYIMDHRLGIVLLAGRIAQL